jgi:hypothetical protein
MLKRVIKKESANPKTSKKHNLPIIKMRFELFSFLRSPTKTIEKRLAERERNGEN